MTVFGGAILAGAIVLMAGLALFGARLLWELRRGLREVIRTRLASHPESLGAPERRQVEAWDDGL
jgi:hypothetical protein